MTPASSRRAALLALALTATACDLVQFASDPKPRFQETWNLPGPDTRMSVANLLPAGTVTIKADSSAFVLQIDSTTLTAGLGGNCAACVALNGTSAIKPAFTMSPGSSTALPADIVSAAITAGTITIALKNNLTFDPLYCRVLPADTATEGFFVIVVRSGSVVLGRDSVRGAPAVSGANRAPLPAGSTLNRTINLTTGTVTTNLTVDVTVNSPIGDQLVPIDVTKSFTATAKVPNIEVASVQMNIPSRTFDSGGKDSVSMPSKADFVVGLGMDMTMTNPFNTVNGTLNLIFAWGAGAGQSISKPVTLPTCATAPCVGLSTVSLDSTETQQLLTAPGKVSIKLTGSVSSASAVTVSPKQEVKIANRMRLTVRTPSGGK